MYEPTPPGQPQSSHLPERQLYERIVVAGRKKGFARNAPKQTSASQRFHCGRMGEEIGHNLNNVCWYRSYCSALADNLILKYKQKNRFYIFFPYFLNFLFDKGVFALKSILCDFFFVFFGKFYKEKWYKEIKKMMNFNYLFTFPNHIFSLSFQISTWWL